MPKGNIPLSANFDPKLKKHLDARQSVTNSNEMSSVEFVQFIPNGFVTYNEAEQKHYTRNGTSWEEFGGLTQQELDSAIQAAKVNYVGTNGIVITGDVISFEDSGDKGQLPTYSTTAGIVLSSQPEASTSGPLVTAVVNANNTITFSDFQFANPKLVYINGFGAVQTDFQILVDGFANYNFDQQFFVFPGTSTVEIICTKTDDSQPFELRMADGNLTIGGGTIWSFSATVYVVQNPELYKYSTLQVNGIGGVSATRNYGTNNSLVAAEDNFARLSYNSTGQGIASVLAGQSAILEHINTNNGKLTTLSVTDGAINLSARNITISGDMQDVAVGGMQYSQDFSANFNDRSLIDKGYLDTAIANLNSNASGSNILRTAKYTHASNLPLTNLTKLNLMQFGSSYSIDLIPGDTLFLHKQTNNVENGLWELDSSYNLFRPASFSGLIEKGWSILITDGEGYDTSYYLYAAGTVGTDPLDFYQTTGSYMFNQFDAKEKNFNIRTDGYCSLSADNVVIDPNIGYAPTYTRGQITVYPQSVELFATDVVENEGVSTSSFAYVKPVHDGTLYLGTLGKDGSNALAIMQGGQFLFAGKHGIQYAPTHNGQPLTIVLQDNSLVTKNYVDGLFSSSGGGGTSYSGSNGISVLGNVIKLDLIEHIAEDYIYLQAPTSVDLVSPNLNFTATIDGQIRFNQIDSVLTLSNNAVTIQTPNLNVTAGSVAFAGTSFSVQTPITYAESVVITQPNQLVNREFVENFIGNRKFVTTLSSVSASTVITHNLNSLDIIVQFRDANGNRIDIVNTITNANSITLNPATTLNNIKIIIMT